MTQQLARLDGQTLEECRRDVRRLDDLCSFRLLEAADHLDLDWAPGLLERAAEAAHLPPDQLSALRLATAGEVEVNPAYRSFPDSVWVHPVTSSSARRVAALQPVLASLVQAGFPSVEAVQKAVGTLAPDARPDEAPACLAAHLSALHRFYSGAADRGLCVVMWWD